MIHIKTEALSNTEFEMKIAMLCAPVLLGIKSANAIALNKDEERLLNGVLTEVPVDHETLYSGEFKTYHLLYRREMIKKRLENPVIQLMMKKFGYLEMNVPHIMERLKNRYKSYRDEKGSFPHEIGLLLDYPPEDVIEYLRCNGQSCRLCGYWKVYYNVENAKKIFRSYDNAKESVRRRVLNGERLRSIAVHEYK